MRSFIESLKQIEKRFIDSLLDAFAALSEHLLNGIIFLFVKQCDLNEPHWRWRLCDCQRPEPQRVGFLFLHQEQEATERVTSEQANAATAMLALSQALRASAFTLDIQPKDSHSPPPYPEFFINH